MEGGKLIELLRHAYRWGRDNGSNRSEKNFNDFLKTRSVHQELRKLDDKEKSEQSVCSLCEGVGTRCIEGETDDCWFCDGTGEANELHTNN